MTNNAPTKEHSHREIMIILSGLMTGMLLAALDQTIVSTALKSIVEDFNGLDHYTWVVTAYLLTSTASTPLYGKISDLYGRRISRTVRRHQTHPRQHGQEHRALRR